MKRKKYLPYIVFILISLAVGGLASFITARGMPYYEALEKPSYTPPPALFPIVWAILYVLMGAGAARVWTKAGAQRNRAIAVFAVQLVINFFWSLWFFELELYLLAFAWLLLLAIAVAFMIRTFYRADKAAGLLQIPYLLWCCFAAWLNFSIWLLNS